MHGATLLQWPFSLSCPQPGKFRWVTTSIARFDPDEDWPTDLDCTLAWDRGLASWDGEGGREGWGGRRAGSA